MSFSKTVLYSRYLWLSKGALAIIDQGVFAGTNFIVNVLLVAWLSPVEYGAFALSYSAFLLLGSLHTAAVTEPMLVFGAGKYSHQFDTYLCLLLRSHLALVFPTVGFVAVLAVPLGMIYSVAVEKAFLGLALAAPFILLLWFVRRVYYVRVSPGWSVVGGVAYLAFVLVSVWTLKATNHLSPSTVFVAMGAGALIASLFLICRFSLRDLFSARAILIIPIIGPLYLLRRLVFVRLLPMLGLVGTGTFDATLWTLPVHRSQTLSPTDALCGNGVALEHWNYGRWSMADAAVSWVPVNIYYAFLPLWGGLEAAGAFRALMILVMPVLHTIAGVSMIVLPVLARKRANPHAQQMAGTVARLISTFVVLSTVYLVVLWGLRTVLFRVLYSGHYSQYIVFPVLIIGLLPFLYSVSGILGCAIRALERPAWIFWSHVGGALAAIMLGLPLAARRGVPGALMGTLISSIITACIMYGFYRRAVKTA